MSHEDLKTGYGTYLSLKNPDMLNRIVELIFDSNPSTLYRGLDVLSESKAWYINDALIEKIPGHVIRVVFKKFGVKAFKQCDSNGVTYVVPMLFENWISETVGKFQTNVKHVITENQYLLSYIRTLIQRCHTDHSILNQ